jgi:hypothetical protein
MKLNDFKVEIKKLLKEHNIVVCRKKYRSPVGRAYVDERRIKIPKIEDLYSAAVAVHEIAHIILDHPKKLPEYIVEYETEVWTLKFLKKHKMHVDYKADFEEYAVNAKHYVSSIIKRQLRLKPDQKIKKRVIKWLDKNI